MKIPEQIDYKKRFAQFLSEEIQNSEIPEKTQVKYQIRTLGNKTLGEYLCESNCLKDANSLIIKNKHIWIDVFTGNKLEKRLIKEDTLGWITMNRPERVIQEEMMNTAVKIDSDLNFDDDKKDMFRNFLSFIAQHFEWNDIPEIHITSVRNGNMTTASYSPETKKVTVYGKNRALADICRSLAHELVHHNQNITNQIKGPVQNIGGEIEDSANAIAGQLIKKFTQQADNVKLYEM
jgi:hypothetical protein